MTRRIALTDLPPAYQAQAQRALGEQAGKQPPAVAAPVAKPNKYAAVRTEVDGVMFDSKKEAARYKWLRTLLMQGQIKWLARQVEFILPGETTYRADFLYEDDGGSLVVEDVKSVITRKRPDYRIKVRQMKSEHRIQVHEV